MRFCFTFRPRFSSAVKAAFLDRDGVINVDYAYVHSRENFHFIPGALEGAAELVRKGHQLIIVTNQSGIGRGKYSIDQFRELTFWLAGVFARNHAPLSAVYSARIIRPTLLHRISKTATAGNLIPECCFRRHGISIST